jgi:hypothetical protein
LNSCGLIAVIRTVAVKIGNPANWLVWNSKRRKNLVVETIFPKKESVDNL